MMNLCISLYKTEKNRGRKIIVKSESQARTECTRKNMKELNVRHKQSEVEKNPVKRKGERLGCRMAERRMISDMGLATVTQIENAIERRMDREGSK